jgi:predicted nucleic acid-binding protein
LIGVVLDAALVLKWFGTEGERGVEAARDLRSRFEAGSLLVLAPPLLALEIINVAGRRWGWDATALTELAGSLDEMGFEVVDPDLKAVARWTGAGLTAYDAAYVALAESSGLALVTDDQAILEVAAEVTRPLADGV